MYFAHITSLADLKKQYRKLAIENHPDKGGDVATMQAINAEFGKLFDLWKDRKETDYNGYENDYMNAKTSQQYTEYVWNEYSWTGSRYDFNLGRNELANNFREFVKEAYPHCKFSIRSHHSSGCQSFYISLIQADFEAFKQEHRERYKEYSYQINHYYLDNDDKLTDRCKEVMKNVIDFVQSFNYDNSNAMFDYFDTNFYTTFSIGSCKKFFTYMPKQLKSADKTYKRKKTATEKAIQDAIGAGNIIGDRKRWNGNEYVPTGEKCLMKGDDLSVKMGYPLMISQDSVFVKRLKAMEGVGIICEVRRGVIYVKGYTPELQAKLDAERAEQEQAEKAFYAKKSNSKTTAKSASVIGGFEIIDYSEKAIALIGDTKPIAGKLKALGGKFNPRLTCGMGWVFPKRKEQKLREVLSA